MDNLGQRFATLDRIAVPDLWPEIQRRAGSSTAVAVTGPTIGWGSAGARPLPNLLRLAVIAGALTAALAIGAFVGSQLLQQRDAPIETTPTTTPTATPAAAELNCVEWQAAAARPADGWPAGARPEGTPGSGWIAAWGAEDNPTLLLIDPTDGSVCEVARFSDYASPAKTPGPATDVRDWIPARGDIAWSPNGQALAFAVIGMEPFKQDVYVLSRDGLAGPVMSPQTGLQLAGLTWAPDGSLLAATETNTSVVPTGELGMLIAVKDGPGKIELECDRPCWGGDPQIAPDGRHVALTIWGTLDTDGESDPESSWQELAVVDLESVEVQRIGNETGLLDTRGLVGWSNPDELLLRESEGRLVGVPIGAPRETVDYGTEIPPEASADELNISPDGTSMLDLHLTQLDQGRIVTIDSSGSLTTIATIDNPWGPVWWAPDGTRIGYLIDVQTDDQGVWLVTPGEFRGEMLAPGELVMPDSSQHVWQPVWPGN